MRSVAFGGLVGLIEPALDEKLARPACWKTLESTRGFSLYDRQKAIGTLREFLAGLKATAGQESSKDLLTRGFAVESWQKAFGFLSERLNGLAEEERGMAARRKELSEKIEVARQKLGQIVSQGGLQRWDATVLVAAPQGGELTLKATYLANNASWTPLYDARLDAASGKVEIAWQAQVAQNNLFGYGTTLRLMAQLSSLRQLFSVNYLDPYFLDTKWTFAFDLYANQGYYPTFIRNAIGGSMTATARPGASARRCQAVALPITPPPMTTTS